MSTESRMHEWDTVLISHERHVCVAHQPHTMSLQSWRTSLREVSLQHDMVFAGPPLRCHTLIDSLHPCLAPPQQIGIDRPPWPQQGW